jgi:hypothetical protein
MPDNVLGTTTVIQVGIVVRNIEAKSRAWAQLLGLPAPSIIITDPVEQAQTEYKGQRTPARAKLAFFQLGQVALELIEPLDGPSTWRDQLKAHGESIHHIAFGVQDMKSKLTSLAGQDMPLIQKGEYTGGRYAYVDSGAALGAILELLENDG